jgi:hypothetical protein
VGGNVDVDAVEGNFETDAEVGDEVRIGIGFVAAQVVMDVDGREDDAEGIFGLAVGGVEGEQESDGVGTSGDCGAEAVAGTEVFAREGKHRYEFTLDAKGATGRRFVLRTHVPPIATKTRWMGHPGVP